MAGDGATNEDSPPLSSTLTVRQRRLERRARLREQEEGAVTAVAAPSAAAGSRRASRRGAAAPSKLVSTSTGPPSRARGHKRRDEGADDEVTASATARASLSKNSRGEAAAKKKPRSSRAAPSAAASTSLPTERVEEQLERRPLRSLGEGGGDDSTQRRPHHCYYNLRATATTVATAHSDVRPEGAGSAAAASSGAALITPAAGTVARHLDFATHVGDDASPEVSAAADDDEAAVLLPPGVVNIFGTNSRRATVACSCPADRCYLADTAVGFSHIAHYGEENGQILKRQESRQLEILRNLLPATAAAAAARRLSSSQESSASSTGTNPDAFPPDQGSSAAGPVSTGSHHHPGGGGARQLNLEGSFGVGGGAGGGILPPAPWSRTSALLRQPYLSPRMRAILVHWLVEVGQEYKVSEPAFHLAVSMLDHLLLKGPTAEELAAHDDEHDVDAEDRWFLITRSNFQAVGCVCAWIAAKLEDRNAPSVEDYVWISDQSFQSNKLRLLEERVCRELEFRLNHVTPYHFVNLFLRASRACPSRSCQHDHPVLRPVVMYLLALSRLSYQLSFCKPSLLTAAAVYLGRATVGIRDGHSGGTPHHRNNSGCWWSPTLEYYTGYAVPDLRDAVLILHRFQLGAEKADDIRGIYNKFSKPGYYGASLKTARRVEDLGLDAPLNHDSMDLGAVAMQPF